MALNQFPRRAFSGAATLQTFTGDGSTTTFTLSQAQYQNECFVYVDDVAQVPVTDYGINGTTLTFTSAPANGSEIIVRGFGVPTPLNDVSDGSITSAKLANGAIETKLGYTPVSPTQLSTEVANLVNSAPSALNTLSELATALNNDASFATTVTNSLANKADTSTVNTALALKVGIDSSTGAATIPVGTTAQRPVSPTNGMLRYNTSNAEYEIYDSSSWQALTKKNVGAYVVEYLLVAGGGGAGTSNGAAGAGAGGLLNGSISVQSSTSYSIVVGGGGATSTNRDVKGTNGTNTTALGLTALGGGGSGSESNTNPSFTRHGNPGGSGGGGVRGGYGGSGTNGQGSFGGSNVNDGGPNYRGGGGGGAGQAGQPGSAYGGGDGGIGLPFTTWASATSTGDSGYYAGGGAGGSYNGEGAGGTGGTRGLGGGGNGGTNYSTSQMNGYANTGGGGGGNGALNNASGIGGSGIAIIRYLGSQRGTGGTITSSGGYTYHTFTSSGTFTA